VRDRYSHVKDYVKVTLIEVRTVHYIHLHASRSIFAYKLNCQDY
jgi:hypothetical protein